eukprot:snap_masked-scaffold_9-processed-gene-5.17-mRNA-1 protein AED:1.00 eAED:1.00 QI:0/0/0/0/1/1/2/0/62
MENRLDYNMTVVEEQTHHLDVALTSVYLSFSIKKPIKKIILTLLFIDIGFFGELKAHEDLRN